MAYDFVSQFTQNLIKDAGLNTLPADYLEDYQLRLEEQVVRRMGIIAMDKMTDEGLEQYTQIMEEADGDITKIDKEKVTELWKNNIPNFSEEMMKGLADFAQEFLKDIKAGKK